MTANEKNPRKKIRVSVIDFLIVITVIACVCGLFVHYKFFENNNEVVTSDTCIVSVMLYGIENDVSDKIEMGDKLFFGKDGKQFGIVGEALKEDSAIYFTNERNEINKGVDNTKKDVSLTVEVKGHLKEDGFYMNGTDYIAAGMEIDVFSPEFSGKGLIFGIEQRSE